MFYRPFGKAVAADVIPYFEDGEFKLFYLKDFRYSEGVGEGCDWNLVTSKDLVHFQEHGTMLLRGSRQEQDFYVFTGSLIKHDGEYYIFYTGHNPHFLAQGKGVQTILLARSDDLLHWNKCPKFVLSPKSDEYEINDFRDPFVYYREEKKRFEMILTARKKNELPHSSRGVLLRAISDDLLHWEIEKKPFYAPDAFFAHECPDLFKMGDMYYLLFSEFSDRYVTTYRMSKSLDGPWVSAKNNTFDGHAFYAAKTAWDGKRRILFGWNPIKNEEDDDAHWEWGGTIIPHQLFQHEDGSLGVTYISEIYDAYNKEAKINFFPYVGNAKVNGNSIQIESDNRTLVSGISNLTRFKLEFDLIPHSETGDYGFFIYEQDNFEQFYKVRFEPLYQRMSFDQWPRYERARHAQIELERPVKMRLHEANHIVCFVDGSILEVYVNGVCMSARMFKIGGNIAFYSQLNHVEFKNIRILEETE